LVEVQIGPPLVAVATSLLPSAEEATAVQEKSGALLGVHVTPEFVEV
jgi:hypothetical protein